MTHAQLTAAVRASEQGYPADVYPNRTCVCDHVDGDHNWTRRGGLRAPLIGECLVTGCECSQFTQPRLIADGMRAA